jgi:hypothetical protein
VERGFVAVVRVRLPFGWVTLGWPSERVFLAVAEDDGTVVWNVRDWCARLQSLLHEFWREEDLYSVVQSSWYGGALAGFEGCVLLVVEDGGM